MAKRSIKDDDADDGGFAIKKHKQSAFDARDCRSAHSASRAAQRLCEARAQEEARPEGSLSPRRSLIASVATTTTKEMPVERLRAENTRLRCKSVHYDALCSQHPRAATKNHPQKEASRRTITDSSVTHTRAGNAAAKTAVEKFVIEPFLERQWSNSDAILRPRARHIAKSCVCGSSRRTEERHHSQTTEYSRYFVTIGRRVHRDALTPVEGMLNDSAGQPHHAKQDAHAAVQVLADPWLWQNITDWMTGLPHAVLEFEQDAIRSIGQKRVDDGASMHDDGKDVWSPTATTESSLPELAIAENNISMLRMIYALRRFAYYRSHRKLAFSHVVRCAIRYKRWEILQWLGYVLPRDPMWPCEPDLMTYAMEQRDFTLMSWVYDTFPDECITLSARQIEVRESGNLALVKWLHEHDYTFSVWMMNGAAARGNLDAVRFLHDHRTEGCTTLAMDLAARFGHLDVVQFLHANRTEGCTEQALDGAAKYGRRSVVQFLLENRSEGRVTSALKTAMAYSQREVVRILQDFLAV